MSLKSSIAQPGKDLTVIWAAARIRVLKPTQDWTKFRPRQFMLLPTEGRDVTPIKAMLKIARKPSMVSVYPIQFSLAV